MEELKKLLLLNVLAAVAAGAVWGCPDQCHCPRAMGIANCSYAGLSDIPSLCPEIQILNLTGNTLTEIFMYSSLNDRYSLRKLVLRDCKLTKIHERGFRNLEILMELDLSKNYLTTLHNHTFQDISSIRWISLSDNQLEKLEDGLFSNLSYLHTLDLSYNKIFQIGVYCFEKVPQLARLKLNNNRLEYLKLETLYMLRSLTILELYDNPWRCDCKLQPLKDWVIRGNVLPTYNDTTCGEPANLHGKSWKELDANDFACQPDIEVIVPTSESAQPTDRLVQISDIDYTLTCQLNGNPLIPAFHWPHNSQWEVKYYICGDYLCMSNSLEERIVKQSKAPTPSAVKNED